MRKLVANPIKKIEQVFPISRFTDDLAASGRVDFTNQIPAGAVVLGWRAKTYIAFTGGASAVISVGKAGGVNDYSQVTTNSVFTVGDDYSNSPVATSLVITPTSPRVTVTEALDFTLITAGLVKVTVYYLDLEAKTI